MVYARLTLALALAGCATHVTPVVFDRPLDGYVAFVEAGGIRTIAGAVGRDADTLCDGARDGLVARRPPGPGVTISEECRPIRVTPASASTAEAWVLLGQAKGRQVVFGASTLALCQQMRRQARLQERLDLAEIDCTPATLERR